MYIPTLFGSKGSASVYYDADEKSRQANVVELMSLVASVEHMDTVIKVMTISALEAQVNAF